MFIKLVIFLKRGWGFKSALTLSFKHIILNHDLVTCVECGCILKHTRRDTEFPLCETCEDNIDELDIDLDIDFDDDILQNVDIRPDMCKACNEVDCAVCTQTMVNESKPWCDGDCTFCSVPVISAKTCPQAYEIEEMMANKKEAK